MEKQFQRFQVGSEGSLLLQTDPEGRLGSSSRVLDTSDDAESKRAKLLYRNRVLQYSRTASTSVPESTYCSTGLSGSRGT